MNQDEILHLVKKIAQYRKSQCWLCHKIEDAIDKLVIEFIRRDVNGMVDNTNSDCDGYDRRAKIQSDTEIWDTDNVIKCGIKEKKVEDSGSSFTITGS